MHLVRYRFPKQPTKFSDEALKESELKLGAANRLHREGNYSTAMGMYLLLHNKHPLKLYIDNALMSVHKLGMKQVSSEDELLRLAS